MAVNESRRESQGKRVPRRRVGPLGDAQTRTRGGAGGSRLEDALRGKSTEAETFDAAYFEAQRPPHWGQTL